MQDEVIIINLTSGAYYSGTGAAADCWTLLSQGATRDEAAEKLAAVYSADQAQVKADLEAAIETLVSRGLLAPSASDVAQSGVELPDSPRVAWAAPAFDEYTDMWDLLQADPIHDVGEAGWPFAVPQKA